MPEGAQLPAITLPRRQRAYRGYVASKWDVVTILPPRTSRGNRPAPNLGTAWGKLQGARAATWNGVYSLWHNGLLVCSVARRCVTSASIFQALDKRRDCFPVVPS